MPASRILVVDDNRDAADMLGILLELRGHDVRVVHDPGSALQVAKDFQPEIGLLDLGLPEMDGCQLARSLRALPGLQAIRLIAVTGWEHTRDLTEAAGFSAHLVKPVAVEALEAALDADARRSKLR